MSPWRSGYKLESLFTDTRLAIMRNAVGLSRALFVENVKAKQSANQRKTSSGPLANVHQMLLACHSYRYYLNAVK